MSRGRSGRTIGLVVGALALLAILGVGALVLFGARLGAYLLARDGAPGLRDENDQIAAMVALGEGRAVFVHGYGMSEPMLVRGVHVDEHVEVDVRRLTNDWSARAPAGYGSHGWMWRQAGEVVVGELHPTQGQGPHRLLCAHRERGVLGDVPSVTSGAWVLSEDGSELLAYGGDALVLYRTSPFAEAWRAPLVGRGVLARLGLTPTLAVVDDGAVHVLRRSDGALVREIGDGRDVAGIDRARGEMLSRRDGALVVESLETGAERLVLELAEGTAIVDGMEEPSLLGGHAGRWLVIYATELDHVSTNNAASWTRYAPRTLAAVDPETGAVVWRTALGPWSRWRPIWNQELYDERELPAELLMYSDSDAEGGGIVGHLAYVSLVDGALRWQRDYPHASRGNHLFASVDDVAYLRIRAPNEGSRSALARFERGRLTSAIWLSPFGGDVREPMLRAEEAWIPSGPDGWSLVGPDLRARASGGPADPPGDARQWAAERLGL